LDGNFIADLLLCLCEFYCPVANTKRLLFNDPDALHLLLDKLAQSVIAYLNQQILSGAKTEYSVLVKKLLPVPFSPVRTVSGRTFIVPPLRHT
jgi:hypothetical protein